MESTTQAHGTSPFTLLGVLLGILLMFSAVWLVESDTGGALTLLACGLALLLFSVYLPKAKPLQTPRVSAGTRTTIAALVLLAVIGGGLGWWVGRADRLSERGRAAYRAKQYRMSAELFGRAAAIDSKNPSLYNDLGWSYLKQSQCFPAREAFQTALRLEPGLADSSRGLEIASRCAASFQQ